MNIQYISDIELTQAAKIEELENKIIELEFQLENITNHTRKEPYLYNNRLWMSGLIDYNEFISNVEFLNAQYNAGES